MFLEAWAERGGPSSGDGAGELSMRPALAEAASKVGSKSNIEDLLTLPTMIFADRSLRRQVRRAVKQEVSTRRAAIGKYGT